jgi:ABC-type Fe3+ transport system substrate-binding protein
VFLTENSPAMTLVDGKRLFAKLPSTTLDRIPDQYRPDDGEWTGIAARLTVLVDNTDQLGEDALPTALMDLAKPEWKHRIFISPTGADFQTKVSAVLATRGGGRRDPALRAPGGALVRGAGPAGRPGRHRPPPHAHHARGRRRCVGLLR